MIDFQQELYRAGELMQHMGELISLAGEAEDLTILPEVRKQLKTVDSILSTIIIVDRMQKAQNN